MRDFRRQTHHFAKDRDDQVARAARALRGIEGGRLARASLAATQRGMDELAEGLGRLRRDNEISACVISKMDPHTQAKHTYLATVVPVHLNITIFCATERDRARLMRESLAAQRRTLSAARLLPAPPLDGAVTRETQELHTLSDALARARGGLVQELVEVFSVLEVGGRPALGGRAGTRGEWTVGGLVLPVPGDIRRWFCSPLTLN